MEFRILGPLEVRDEGRAIPLRGAKQRALLAILLLHANEVVSTDRLIDELWGERAAGAVATALQVRVSQLRKALGLRRERSSRSRRATSLRVERGAARPAPLRAISSGASHRCAIRRSRRRALREALGAVARAGARRLRVRAVRPAGDRAPRGAAPGRPREAHRRRPRARAACASSSPSSRRSSASIRCASACVRQLMLALYRSGRQADALAAYRRRASCSSTSSGSSRAGAAGARARDPPPGSGSRLASRLPRRSARSWSAPLDAVDSTICVALAEPLARRPARELILAQLIDVAPSGLAEASALARERTPGRSQSARSGGRGRPRSRPTVAGADLVRLATEQDVDLVLVEASAALLDDATLRHVLQRCTVRRGRPRPSRRGPASRARPRPLHGRRARLERRSSSAPGSPVAGACSLALAGPASRAVATASRLARACVARGAARARASTPSRCSSSRARRASSPPPTTPRSSSSGSLIAGSVTGSGPFGGHWLRRRGHRP